MNAEQGWWSRLRQRGQSIDEQLRDKQVLRAGDRVIQRDLLTRRRGRTGTLVRPVRVGLYAGWLIRADHPSRFSRSGMIRVAAFALQKLDPSDPNESSDSPSE